MASVKSTPPVGRKLTPKQEAIRRRALRRRRNQLLVIGGLVAVTVAVIIGIAIVISQPTNFEKIPAAATTDERPFELGPADAKVTIEEFGDFQCPACQQWHVTTQGQVIDTYIKAKKDVKFVFKPYPFLDGRSTGRESHVTQEGAYCAGDQNRYWDYHNALYDNQPKGENTGYWTTDRVKELAKVLKLNTDTFNSCMDSNKYRNKTNTDATTAVSRGVTGTPTIAVNGKLLATSDFSAIQKAVDEALTTATK